MPIFKIEKREHPYVQIDKRLLGDVTLSWKAKGILSYLLSKPKDWKVRLTDIVKRSKNGEDSVRSGIAELKTTGYIQMQQGRDKGKYSDVVYAVYEQPHGAKPDAVKPDAVKPDAVNPVHSNKELTKNEHSKDSAPSTVRAETPKAVKIFRAAAHRFPPKAWYLDIASRVGGEEADLIRWGGHVKSWVGRGYNPINIEGILESFEQGGLKKRRQPRDGDRAPESSADRRKKYAREIELMQKAKDARRQADGTDV